MTQSSRLALLAIVLCAVPATITVACQPADLVIVNARLAGTDGNDATVSVSGDRICALARASGRPTGDVVIDARGMTVLPGLIDAHVHLFPMGSRAGIDDDETLNRFVHDELPARLRDYLERGVTTLFSVGDAWPAVLNVRRRIAAGEIAGPRLLITGPILTAPGGYPAATICADSEWCRSRLTVELRDAGHARRTVAALAADGVDAIKVVYDDARAEKLSADMIRVVSDEAHAHRLPVVVHTTSVADALEVAALGVDMLAHLPSGGAIAPDAAAQLQRRNIVVISTAGVYAPLEAGDGTLRTVFGLRYGPPFDRLHAQGLANARVLLDAGVPLAFGSGTAMFRPPESLDGEIAALAQIPLSAAQLLDAMTVDAARALGIAADLGSLEVGKRADLVIVNAGSGANMASADIVVVIKDGRIVIDRREPNSPRKEKP